MDKHSHIELYRGESGDTEILVKLEDDTVWLNLNQISDLFQRDKSVVSRHIRNIFDEGELEREATVAKFATVQVEGGREIERSIDFFNLDVIISVGYRIKSKRGTHFRIWANRILKEYLIQGYAINESQLEKEVSQLRELQESVKLLGTVLASKKLTSDESTGLLKIISDYAYAFDLLDQYDYQRLKVTGTSGKETYRLSYAEAIEQIKLAKQTHGNSDW